MARRTPPLPRVTAAPRPPGALILLAGLTPGPVRSKGRARSTFPALLSLATIDLTRAPDCPIGSDPE
jgi:hypothetical protein